MRIRNLIIGLVVTVAVVTPVFLIWQGGRGAKSSDYAPPGGPVLVSNRDIEMGQELDPLIEEGIFSELWVPDDALIDGAITDIDQLRGTTALVEIPRNHQISAGNVMQLDEA